MPTRGNWFVIVGYGLVAAATQMLWLTFAPITTNAASYFNVSEGAIGILSIIFPLVYVVLAIPFGLWLDRWLRPALALGAILTGVGGLVRLVGDSFVSTTVGQVIVSIGQPLVLSAITALCVQYLPRSQRATGIAVGSAALFSGMLIAFVTGAALADDIATLLLIQGLLGALAAVILCVGLLRPGRFALSDDEASPAALERPLRTVWADPVIRPLVLIVAVGFGVFVSLTTWLQALLEPAGVTTDAASIMLLVMVVAGIVGAAVLPPIAAKLHNQLTWLFIAIVASFLGCLVLALVPGDVSGIAVSAVLGLLLLATLPIVLEMVEERTGPAASTATALVWLAGNLGGVALSVIVGLFVNQPGIGFGLTAVVALVAGLPLIRALRKRLAREASHA